MSGRSAGSGFREFNFGQGGAQDFSQFYSGAANRGANTSSRAKQKAQNSTRNLDITKDIVLIGEVGLTGEVRSVNLIDKRLKEVERLGFKRCIIPENNKKLLKDKYNLDIIGVRNINDALKALGIK